MDLNTLSVIKKLNNLLLFIQNSYLKNDLRIKNYVF